MEYIFFLQAFFNESEKNFVWYAFFGSLTGALVFGCRPPIALANVLLIPLFSEYIKKRQMNLRMLSKMAFSVSPYIVIGILLMSYNYLRFESPFEFGQTYQLTSADQSGYGSFLSQFHIVKMINGLASALIAFTPLRMEFPYFSYSGAFINFPILMFSYFALVHKEVRDMLREKHLFYVVMILTLLPVLIVSTDVLWAPYFAERYRMDFYWVLGISCYLTTGSYYLKLLPLQRKKFGCFMTYWAFATICKSFLLFLIPWDSNFTDYFPSMLEEIRRVLMFGKVYF